MIAQKITQPHKIARMFILTLWASLKKMATQWHG